MSVDVGFLSSEFPNDNPALHGGVIWVCLEPTGRPLPELVPRREPVRAVATTLVVAEPVVDPIAETIASPVIEPVVEEPVPPTIIDVMTESDDEGEIVVEELEPMEPVETVCAAVVFESIAPPSTDTNDASELPPPSDDPFTTLVCTLADVAIGAGSPNLAALLPGLLFDARVPDVLDEDSATMLKAAGVWNGDSVEPQFIATVNAWRGILRGTSDDFSACGAMLDEWASDLLARLLDTKAAAPRFRQELRTRGVAAFGLA